MITTLTHLLQSLVCIFPGDGSRRIPAWLPSLIVIIVLVTIMIFPGIPCGAETGERYTY